MTESAPRNLVGYGRDKPQAAWPGGARVAVSFVVNYEEGGEHNVLDGDPHSEPYLIPDIVGLPPVEGRNLLVEDLFAYGSRAGFWRLLELFEERGLKFTCWAVGLALQRNPEAGRAMAELGHEVASHAWRWIDYAGMPENEEREHIRKTVAVIEELTGQGPRGWYTGRYSANTRRLVMEETGTIYDSDAYDDDLPYWTEVAGKPRLIVPYALDSNDFKYAMSPGWLSGDDFAAYLRNAFDRLYEEGARSPKMMTVALHGRLSGRPARTQALARFMDHVQAHDKVWVCTREEIARHWMAGHPAKSGG
jgi:putative urate catabolism protein